MTACSGTLTRNVIITWRIILAQPVNDRDQDSPRSGQIAEDFRGNKVMPSVLRGDDNI
ncbi:MAG: hypothetical protein ACK5PB_05550 [Pirellula sp.]